MLYGLYQSAGGAAAAQGRLEVVANNMANAGTAGFKRQLALAGHHRPHPDNAASTGFTNPLDHFAALADGFSPRFLNPSLADSTGGNSLAATALDLSQGPLEETGGDLDVALAGPGFFQARDADGRVTLTRDGRFTRAPDGTLTTAEGRPVLSESGGPIALPANAEAILVAGDGTVSARQPGGATAALGRLAIVAPRDPQSLRRHGDGRLTADGPVAPVPPGVAQVRQGYVEGSGVDAVKETLNVIQSSRAFETNLNLVKLQDETLGRLLNVARPS